MRGGRPTILPRLLTGKAISVAIFERFRRPQASIYIVSPFLQDYAFLGTSPLSSLLLNHLSSGARVTVLTKPPAGKDVEKASAKEKYVLLRQLHDRGIRVLLNDRLHAKVYMFQESDVTKSFILGSANLTFGGMEQWLEIALASYNHDLYESVNRAIVRFEYDHDTMALLRWAGTKGIP